MARAIWNFRLVSIPVKLFTAIRANAVCSSWKPSCTLRRRTVTRTSRTKPHDSRGARPGRSRRIRCAGRGHFLS